MHGHSKQESHEHQHQPHKASPSSGYKMLKLAIAAMLSIGLLMFSGLALTGTVLTLVVVTPILVLFSPILVPAGTVLSLAATGFVFSGGCGVAAINALIWLYNYASRELVKATTKSSFVQIGL